MKFQIHTFIRLFHPANIREFRSSRTSQLSYVDLSCWRNNGSMILSNGLHPGLVMDRSITRLDRFENRGADDSWRKTSKRSDEHFDSNT